LVGSLLHGPRREDRRHRHRLGPRVGQPPGSGFIPRDALTARVLSLLWSGFGADTDRSGPQNEVVLPISPSTEWSCATEMTSGSSSVGSASRSAPRLALFTPRHRLADAVHGVHAMLAATGESHLCTCRYRPVLGPHRRVQSTRHGGRSS